MPEAGQTAGDRGIVNVVSEGHADAPEERRCLLRHHRQGGRRITSEALLDPLQIVGAENADMLDQKPTRPQLALEKAEEGFDERTTLGQGALSEESLESRPDLAGDVFTRGRHRHGEALGELLGLCVEFGHFQKNVRTEDPET